MAGSMGNQLIGKIAFGFIDISKISLGNTLIYSAGNVVTYHIDTNVVYQEDVDADETVLSPKTFTPSKIGWEFVGWRQDTTANGTVLNNLTMGDEPITLYAVFRQAVTVTYYNGNTNKQTSTGYKYYNNVNTTNPTFTIAQSTLSGWTARGWSTTTSGNGGISYNSISNTEISTDITLYGMYYQTITLTLYNGSATASPQTGIRYYNSGANAYVNPTFTVTATSISGWSFRGWSTSSAGNSAISYTAISNTEFAANATLYALYQITITLSYNGNGNTSGSTAAQTGIRYYSSAGTYVNPSFTVATNGFTKTAYSFVRWRLNSTSGTAYSPNASITLSSNATLYAEWTYSGAPFYIVQNNVCKQTLPWYYNQGSNIKANSFSTKGFSAVSDYPQIQAISVDGTQTAYFWAYSGSINTNGNKNLEITAFNPMGTFSITVNGVNKQGGEKTRTTLTFDISSLTSFTITASVTTWAPNGDPYLMFRNIRLY